MSAAVGGAAVLLFSVFRHHVRVYKARLLYETVTFKPPDVPGFGRGVSFIWNWAVHVIRISERVLYDTAGLDALYYDRANRLRYDDKRVESFFPHGAFLSEIFFRNSCRKIFRA